MWTLGLVKYGIYFSDGENASWIVQHIPYERVRGVTGESVSIVPGWAGMNTCLYFPWGGGGNGATGDIMASTGRPVEVNAFVLCQ